MKNIDKIARLVARNGAANILIHSLPGTNCWLLCEKIEQDKWIITMLNPKKYTTYNLGTVSNQEHLELWTELIRKEIDIKASVITRAKELRQFIRNFLKVKIKHMNSQKRKIKSLQELKQAISEGHNEFAISLKSNLKSVKMIRLNSKGFFVVENNIDGSIQRLSESQINDSSRSNIGRAMAMGAFYINE